MKENARLLTFVFNNLVLDHQTDSRLRRFPDPMASRHLANEIRPEVVEALMTAAERHHGAVHRYYRLKGRLLGLDALYDYDRYAPLFSDMPACDWDKGRRIVRESYQAFSPKAGAVIGEFFEKRWIDAELRPGKRGGAFSSSAVPSVHPYILMNYTDQLRDVMTLAHELGHGLHQYLARLVGYFQCDTPLTTAETASVSMASRHLANEIRPEVVEALMTAAERHHGAVHRYYRLKGGLLGLDSLYDYDRYALFSPTCRPATGTKGGASSGRVTRRSARRRGR